MDDRTPPEVEALVCDLYRRKETLGVIAEAAGVSVKTVYSILDRNGIPRRTRRQTDPLAVSPSECVTCRKAPPEKNSVLCVRCRAVAAIKREQFVRRMQSELA